MLRLRAPINQMVCDATFGETEREDASDHLARALITDMIAHAPMPQIVCSREGRMVAANKAARSLCLAQRGPGSRPMRVQETLENALLSVVDQFPAKDSVVQLSLSLPSGRHAFRVWSIKPPLGKGRSLLMLACARPRWVAAPADASRFAHSLCLDQLEADRARLRREAERLQRLCLTDALTGILNRSGFARAVRKSMRGPEQAGHLCFIDLDGFKAVNDALGHGSGDALLRQVARCLRGFVDKRDSLARLGGDEFAIWISGAQHDRIAGLESRISEEIATTCEAQLKEAGLPAITASVGIAHAPEDGLHYARLVRIADDRMYGAKGSVRMHRQG